MSDADRGAYTPPTDPPLTFDARQPVRGSRPLPITLIASAVVLLILIAAIIYFYSSGVRKDGEPPRTVGTPVAQMKVAPPPEPNPPIRPRACRSISPTRAPNPLSSPGSLRPRSSPRPAPRRLWPRRPPPPRPSL
jgi:hypothetical protein